MSSILSKLQCVNSVITLSPFYYCMAMYLRTLYRLISAVIGLWVTPDPAELPILPGRKKLCTNTVEYNPYVSKAKTPVSVRLIIEIQHIYVFHMIIKRYQVFFFNFANLKTGICDESPPKMQTVAETLLGDC